MLRGWCVVAEVYVLRQVCNVKVPLSAVFDSSDLASLAKIVEATRLPLTISRLRVLSVCGC